MNRRATERGTVLMLMPAAVLIVLLLGAIAVDLTVVHLRQRAGITGEVRVLGRINFLEVWNEDRFVDKLAREPWTDDDGLLLSQHGI